MGHPAHEEIQNLLATLENTATAELQSRARRVFCNRNLNMRGVEHVGFDMDYTLAQYHQDALDALSHHLTLERLHTVKGYPETILEIEPRPQFAIRGLVIDKLRGNLFKMDAHRFVGKCFHGFDAVDTEDFQDDYLRKPVRFTQGGRFHLVDTLFALPEAFLYAALVDFFAKHPEHPAPSYEQLYDDIRSCIDLAHRDDSIKNAILADIPRYIVHDPELAITLHKLRSAGKRLFLLTNSYWRYSSAVMSFLLDDALSQYPSWRHYFDIIITGARKPIFFSGSEPFLKLADDGQVLREEKERFESNRLYQGGNLLDFERILSTGGPTILYVGDHIYGDILKSRKTSSWRTCMLVQEMEDELARADLVRRETTERDDLQAELRRINNEIYFMTGLERRFDDVFSHVTDPDDPIYAGARKDLVHATERAKRRRKKIIADIHRLNSEIESSFNAYWGLLFQEGNENSIFGKQLQDYACLYTSRVSNLSAYSPLHHFRAPPERLPHEL